MILYIVVAIIPLIVGEWFKNVDKSDKRYYKKRLKYILFASLPMFLLIGLRNQHIGADTINYLNHFIRISDTPWPQIFEGTRMEYGYIVFVKIVSLLTNNPLIFQLVCALIYWVSISVFSNHLEEAPFLFLFMFCTLGTYTFMFTGVRQCLAICICLLSYPLIKKQKLFSFLLCILLAYFFHKSSMLFIAAYFIAPRKINAINTIIFSALCGVSIAYLDVIQTWFNDQLDYNYGIESTESGTIFLIFLLIMMFFTVFIVFTNHGENKNVRGLINIGFVALFFWILRLFTRVAERPSFYFIFFIFAACAHAIAIMKNVRERDIVKIVLVTLCLSLYVYRFMTNFATYVPYQLYSFEFYVYR